MPVPAVSYMCTVQGSVCGRTAFTTETISMKGARIPCHNPRNSCEIQPPAAAWCDSAEPATHAASRRTNANAPAIFRPERIGNVSSLSSDKSQDQHQDAGADERRHEFPDVAGDVHVEHVGEQPPTDERADHAQDDVAD